MTQTPTVIEDSRICLISEVEHQRMDEIEAAIVENLEPYDFPVDHGFIHSDDPAKRFYVRTILMPKGSVLTSYIHNSEHTYQITKGAIYVAKGSEGDVLKAPFAGVTYPGTRRALLALEDTVWTTFHPNPTGETDPVKLVQMLTDIRPESVAIAGGAR